MNKDILKGKWNEMKGELKVKWANLTDDDWTRISGDRDKLIGMLQQRYGRSKDEMSREVDEFFDDWERRNRKVS
jgi:uncharacterized protein YjbJ (UPF0337 family)